MKTRWIYAAVLVTLGSSDSLKASYVIKLKNGNEYVTTRYWSEGKQLLFDAYGGVFGIDSTFVAKIEKSLQPGLTTTKEENAAVSGQSDTTAQKNSAASTPPAETHLEKQPRLNDPIVNEFSQLRDKSKEVDRLLTSEIIELLTEITAFRNKLSSDSKLFIDYGREFNEAQEIGATVESALRSRTQ